MHCSIQLSENPAELYLFAHQDDESGIFQKIIEATSQGAQVYCAYLTSGTVAEASPEERDKESLAILSKLGVAKENVFFAGATLRINDAALPLNLQIAAAWIRDWIRKYSNIQSIYVPAWEGGHQDHDALHAITVEIAAKLGLIERVRQFSLYNAYRCPGPFFKVFSPLRANGLSEKIRISWKQRCCFLRYCLSYPSQTKTWIGLFPFVVFDYLFHGCQILQPVSLARINERPHPGVLYYEKRKFFTWGKMQACIIEWLNVQRTLEH